MSSIRPTMYASVASCIACKACDWNRIWEVVLSLDHCYSCTNVIFWKIRAQ